jgi:hypothetical protein
MNFDASLAALTCTADRAGELMRVAAEQIRELRADRDKLRGENDLLKARLRIADAKFARLTGNPGLSMLLMPQAE